MREKMSLELKAEAYRAITSTENCTKKQFFLESEKRYTIPF
jgi:hypothetical protein